MEQNLWTHFSHLQVAFLCYLPGSTAKKINCLVCVVYTLTIIWRARNRQEKERDDSIIDCLVGHTKWKKDNWVGQSRFLFFIVSFFPSDDDDDDVDVDDGQTKNAYHHHHHRHQKVPNLSPYLFFFASVALFFRFVCTVSFFWIFIYSPSQDKFNLEKIYI